MLLILWLLGPWLKKQMMYYTYVGTRCSLLAVGDNWNAIIHGTRCAILPGNTRGWWKNTRYAHPGARFFKCAPPIHSIPFRPDQPGTFTSHSIQTQVTLMAFGFGLGFGSGGRPQAPRPNPPKHAPGYMVLSTWYLIPGTYLVVFRHIVEVVLTASTFHRTGVRCISNWRTRMRIKRRWTGNILPGTLVSHTTSIIRLKIT